MAQDCGLGWYQVTMGQHKIILVMGLKMSQTYSNWFELLFFTLLSMRAKPKETSKQLGACSLRKKKKKSNGLIWEVTCLITTVTTDKPTL